jgi:O-antigen ligase
MSRINSFSGALISYTVILLLTIPFIPLNIINFLGLGLGYILIIGLFHPRLGLFLFLLTRPALDYFTGQELLGIGSYDLNLAALWGVAALLLTAYVIYNNFSRIQELPLSRPWLIFLMIVLITLPFSSDTALSIRELIRLLTIFSFFVLGYTVVAKNEHLTGLLKVIIFSMLVPGVFAYYQFFTDSGLTLPLEDIYNRIYGTFAHPNLFAFYLIAPLTLTLIIVAVKNKKSLSTYGFGALLLFFFSLLILTYTRGAWMAFILAVAMIGLLRYRKMLVAAMLVLIVLYGFVPTIQERANKIIRPDPYGSVVWRLKLWQDGLEYIRGDLWTGYGAGTAKKTILENRGESKGSPHPHNDYLKIALEYGILGVLAYLYLLISTVVIMSKRYRQESRPVFKNIYLGVLALTVALFVMSIGDNMIRNTALQWSLWALIGGVLTLPIYKK